MVAWDWLGLPSFPNEISWPHSFNLSTHHFISYLAHSLENLKPSMLTPMNRTRACLHWRIGRDTRTQSPHTLRRHINNTWLFQPGDFEIFFLCDLKGIDGGGSVNIKMHAAASICVPYCEPHAHFHITHIYYLIYSGFSHIQIYLLIKFEYKIIKPFFLSHTTAQDFLLAFFTFIKLHAPHTYTLRLDQPNY